MTSTPLNRQQWWDFHVWPRWIKKQANRLVAAYSKAVLGFMEDEAGAVIVLVALILLGCMVVSSLLLVILLALIGTGLISHLAYYFMFDKTQEEALRMFSKWAFFVSSGVTLVAALPVGIVQLLWLIKFY